MGQIKYLKTLLVLLLVILFAVEATAQGETVSNTYTRVISSDQLVDGGIYVIAKNSKALSKIKEGKYGESITVVVSDDKSICTVNIENTAENPYEFVLLKTDVENRFAIGNLEGYIGGVDDTTFKFSETRKTSAPYLWDFVMSENFNFGIKVSNQNRYISLQNNAFKLYTTSGALQLYRKTASEIKTLQIGSTGCGTMYYGDSNLLVPQGITATTYTYDNDILKVQNTYVYGDVIPKATAVVVQGESNTEYQFIAVSTADTSPEGNVLKGTDEDYMLPDNDDVYYYKLSRNSSGDNSSVGFYWGASGGGAFKNPAHKAYLELDRCSVAYGKSEISLGSSTEINGLLYRADNKDSAIYSLSGVKIKNKTQSKGIYIKSGKKFVIK